METPDYNRENIYSAEPINAAPDPMADFKAETGNRNFRISKLTWLSLFIIALFYPGVSLLTYEDPSIVFANMTDGLRMVLLVSTIVVQWFLFMFVYLAVFRERTFMAGIGVGRIKMVHFAWAVAFLAGAWVILSGLAWMLAQIGLPMAGEIAMMIPQDTTGRIVWVLVSATAGFCEETMFRGYLMSRLRLVFKMESWLWPVIISAVVFGACHAYQGLPGFIVLTVYGAMFALLYIRTKSLWPCILAHFMQDFLALFIPQ